MKIILPVVLIMAVLLVSGCSQQLTSSVIVKDQDIILLKHLGPPDARVVVEKVVAVDEQFVDRTRDRGRGARKMLN